MGKLYDIIQAHIDAQPYAVSVRQVAKALGVTPTTVANWREPKDLPRREHLEAVARVTGTPYRLVFAAASADVGYLDRADGDALLAGEVDELREAVRAAREAGASREELLAILESETG